MPKVIHTTYVLSTVRHDGRYMGVKGQNDLADHVANRLWSLDGVVTVESEIIHATGDFLTTLPKGRYEELVKAEQQLKELTNVS